MRSLKLHTLTLSLLVLIINGCNGGIEESTGNGENDPVSLNEYELVWQEEFDYTGLPDTSKWFFDTEGNAAGWGNDESQYYTFQDTANAYVSEGTLKIIAKEEEREGKSFTSARLVSRQAWQYGRIVVSAMIPTGRGSWSALWMMPGGWTFHDGNWPAVGEIDLMEHVGHDPGVVHASAHSQDYQWQNKTQKTGIIEIPDIYKSFQVFVLDWTPDHIKAYANDSLFFTYENEGLGESKWPYDKAFSLIMNVAVGGMWGAILGIDKEAFPQVMEIDYVRVYQPKDPLSK